MARPGEPGGDTWNDLPLEQRNGGSVWVTGSYDPKLELVYFGPAPTYDTAPLLERVEKEGVSNEALFTNATVALDATTGKLAWYYQHLANDQWDLDWAFERQVVDLPVDGVMRRAVVNVGKLAIVEALDAATGEYLFSIDLGLQNVIASIDPETGKKTINPGVEIDLTEPRLVCPTVVGARSWPPTSFEPGNEDAVPAAQRGLHDVRAGRIQGSVHLGDRLDHGAAPGEQRRQHGPAPGRQPRDAGSWPGAIASRRRW